VRIGINPISWTNDDLPALGGETPLETALTEGKAIGYEGFELGNKFPREPRRCARCSRVTGSPACRAGIREGSRAERSLTRSPASSRISTLLAANGAQVMVYGEVADAIQGRPEALARRPPLQERRGVVGLRRARHGVREAHARPRGGLAYHHHMGAYVETPEDVDRLMRVTGPEVGLLHDTGHVTFAGGDAATELAKHVERVCHVHCKDVRPAVARMARNRGWSFLESC
jgi:inosose dehydratase